MPRAVLRVHCLAVLSANAQVCRSVVEYNRAQQIPVRAASTSPSEGCRDVQRRYDQLSGRRTLNSAERHHLCDAERCGPTQLRVVMPGCAGTA